VHDMRPQTLPFVDTNLGLLVFSVYFCGLQIATTSYPIRFFFFTNYNHHSVFTTFFYLLHNELF
jgi:hypothetical protein